VSRHRRAGRVVVALALIGVGAKLPLTGCDDTGSYIYSGEQYDPTLQCLEPVSSIDIIGGNEPLTPCAPVCILSLPQDASAIAYVSTMCGPYPFFPYELDAGSDPLCIAALEAFRRDALCVDGGVYVGNPEAGEEAGTEASTGDAMQVADTAPSDTGSSSDASDAASGTDASDAASGSDATASDAGSLGDATASDAGSASDASDATASDAASPSDATPE
jgi:hypothetical protein